MTHPEHLRDGDADKLHRLRERDPSARSPSQTRPARTVGPLVNDPNASVRAFALDALRRLDAIEEEDARQEADFRRGYRR